MAHLNGIVNRPFPASSERRCWIHQALLRTGRALCSSVELLERSSVFGLTLVRQGFPGQPLLSVHGPDRADFSLIDCDSTPATHSKGIGLCAQLFIRQPHAHYMSWAVDRNRARFLFGSSRFFLQASSAPVAKKDGGRQLFLQEM